MPREFGRKRQASRPWVITDGTQLTTRKLFLPPLWVTGAPPRKRPAGVPALRAAIRCTYPSSHKARRQWPQAAPSAHGGRGIPVRQAGLPGEGKPRPRGPRSERGPRRAGGSQAPPTSLALKPAGPGSCPLSVRLPPPAGPAMKPDPGHPAGPAALKYRTQLVQLNCYADTRFFGAQQAWGRRPWSSSSHDRRMERRRAYD